MADRRVGPGRDGSGTAGGADLEPLRGGMDEVERGEVGPEHGPGTGSAHDEPRRSGRDAAGPPGASQERPAAPYHDATLPEGGLAPRAEPGEGPTPAPSRGELEAAAGRKIADERANLEREGANAHRRDPAARGADE